MGLSINGIPLTFGGQRVSTRLPLPKISVSGKNFMRNGTPYKVWGWHSSITNETTPFIDFLDPDMRPLIEREMINNGKLRTNVMRIFVQLFECVSGPNKNSLVFNQTALGNILFLLDKARENGIYIKLCGANVWVPSTAPAWFDALGHADRWDVQEFFYTELVKGIVNAGHATTIFGYDLVGEPVVKTDPDYPWYGEESYPGDSQVSGLYVNPCIARGAAGTDQSARDWITQLTTAIKAVDPDALCTVGTLPFVGGAFGRDNTQDLLDFVSPHIYPATVENERATVLAQATGWAASTKPVVCGEYMAWTATTHDKDLLDIVIGSMNGAISWGAGQVPEDVYIDPNLPLLELIQAALAKYNLSFFIENRNAFLANNK